MILGDYRAGIALRRGHTRCPGRIDTVVFAPRAARQFAHPRRRGARHVEHNLTMSQQPLRQVMTQPFGVLDRPLPIWPLLGPGQRPPVVGQRGLDTQRTQIGVSDRIHRGGGVRTLVRVDADDDHGQRIPFLAL